MMSWKKEKSNKISFDCYVLLENLEKVHTTKMGETRIKRNLNLDKIEVVTWCKEKIGKENSIIYQKGKNYYVINENIIITINRKSYTIITAHLLKK